MNSEDRKSVGELNSSERTVEPSKIRQGLAKYAMVTAILLSLCAVAVGGYNTYLIWQIQDSLEPTGTPNVKELNSSEANKLIDEGAATMGNPNAKVTLVEFADFQCPFCKIYFSEILPQIKQRYVDTGKVRFVFVNYAFLGPESQSAAEAAKCAKDQDRFWEYHDHLYANQQGENIGAFSQDKLKKFASDLKLDVGKFNECFDSGKYSSVVIKELEAGQSYGVRGTPATFVDGTFISGIQSAPYFFSKIDEALNKK
jgi:protein-disulfide isomerase